MWEVGSDGNKARFRGKRAKTIDKKAKEGVSRGRRGNNDGVQSSFSGLGQCRRMTMRPSECAEKIPSTQCSSSSSGCVSVEDTGEAFLRHVPDAGKGLVAEADECFLVVPRRPVFLPRFFVEVDCPISACRP